MDTARVRQFNDTDALGLVFGGRTLRDDPSLQDVPELDNVRKGLHEGR